MMANGTRITKVIGVSLAVSAGLFAVYASDNPLFAVAPLFLILFTSMLTASPVKSKALDPVLIRNQRRSERRRV